MNEATVNQAFEATHQEAERLLGLGPQGALDVSGGLQLIMSIARYKHDIRSAQEIQSAQVDSDKRAV